MATASHENPSPTSAATEDYLARSLEAHYRWHGKLETVPKMKVDTDDALALAYTPGVAQPCLEIQKDPEKGFELTGRGNLVAVVTDGSAILGLGNIGPEAGMPVMEGKCVLFKAFAGIDAVPLCVRTQDPNEFVHTVALLQGSFDGINLEDISAPRCFEIEEKLAADYIIPKAFNAAVTEKVAAAVADAARASGVARR